MVQIPDAPWIREAERYGTASRWWGFDAIEDDDDEDEDFVVNPEDEMEDEDGREICA